VFGSCLRQDADLCRDVAALTDCQLFLQELQRLLQLLCTCQLKEAVELSETS